MNIAVMTPYGDYYNEDRLFDPAVCNIGQNLLQPGIELQKSLKEQGHAYHTYDMFRPEDVDRLVCFDIPQDSKPFIDTLHGWLRYIHHKRWEKDGFLKLMKTVPVENRNLIVQEPPVVSPKSYKKKYHKYFGKVLTWNPDLWDGKKYFPFAYPQPVPEKTYEVPFSEKRMFTQISGNKKGIGPGELYSERRKVIDFFEGNEKEFDFYGVGWDSENLKNYKGRLDDKLETLSKYKFSFTYENCKGLRGYITEKMFDCFFAGVVPVYWGAEDIDAYIPKECYIDMRRFSSIEDVVRFCESMSEEAYQAYTAAAKRYLKSDAFYNTFSTEAYILRITEAIL